MIKEGMNIVITKVNAPSAQMKEYIKHLNPANINLLLISCEITNIWGNRYDEHG
jgi:hypothetical protein